MDVKSILNPHSGSKIRYAIVGAGDISQAAMMPGVAHTGNSEMTAIVTGDPQKARELKEKYQIASSYSYEEFSKLLGSGDIDAIYLGTPNWMHADFIVPALRAGIHVLTEKPLEVSTARCEEILQAKRQSRAKLMVAYRLHFEPATLAAIEIVRSGQLGALRTFSSMFSQMVDPQNHRSRHGVAAGPLFDMGPYPVNATRYMFGDEPIEVLSAHGIRHEDSGLGELDDTVAVTLKFPHGQLAQFTVSYAAHAVDQFRVTGTLGSLELNPAFTYGKSLEHHLTIGEKKSDKSFKSTDQFGGEMKYFSDCILNDVEPEPGFEEGYNDVHILEAIQKSIDSGQPQKIEGLLPRRQIDTKVQEQLLRATSRPKEVNAKSPTLGQ